MIDITAAEFLSSGIPHIKTAFFIIFSLLCFIQDIRKRSIGLLTFIIFTILGILLELVFCMPEIMEGVKSFEFNGTYISDLLASLLREAAVRLLMPASLILISFATREGIGYGDSLYFLVAALYIAPSENFILFTASILLAGLAGLFTACKAAIRGESIKGRALPFMAFILPAAIMIKGLELL